MGVAIGIVGLPNIGKSTLFNAITNASVQAENYPFCTIEPNKGIVPILDKRLDILSEMNHSQKITYATIEFIDIAGLVKGASKGEGMGNKFLSHIREASAIAHVVRCFEDSQVVHVHGRLNPLEDIEIINLELLFADLELAEKAYNLFNKKSKGQDKDDAERAIVFERICSHLKNNKPVRILTVTERERELIKGYDFLTAKPVIYVANISEELIGKDNTYVKQVHDYALAHQDACLTLCAKLEAEMSQLDAAEKQVLLKEYGIPESGLDQLARAGFDLLGLQTYLTSGEKETRAWPIKKGTRAPQAAGVIHTDFEHGFIRASICSYKDYIACGGLKHAREKGLVRQEGKDYVMQEGDIVEFLFNV